MTLHGTGVCARQPEVGRRGWSCNGAAPFSGMTAVFDDEFGGPSGSWRSCPVPGAWGSHRGAQP
eukprot:1658751-Lingulodinium_polyedra.AAC.1